jgi:23S rRNA pseudouridine2457 synthase
LSEFGLPEGVYAAGRLDKDSEGLLILTDDGPFQKKLTDPNSKKEKSYFVQVEGAPTLAAFKDFKSGLKIQNYTTRPAQVRIMPDFSLPAREPPIRSRKSIPTTWIEVILIEGKNRQVRKMCAAVGFPCLRLVRGRIGKLRADTLKAGEWMSVSKSDILGVFGR